VVCNGFWYTKVPSLVCSLFSIVVYVCGNVTSIDKFMIRFVVLPLETGNSVAWWLVGLHLGGGSAAVSAGGGGARVRWQKRDVGGGLGPPPASRGGFGLVEPAQPAFPLFHYSDRMNATTVHKNATMARRRKE
jgi:hypothetical protein